MRRLQGAVDSDTLEFIKAWVTHPEAQRARVAEVLRDHPDCTYTGQAWRALCLYPYDLLPLLVFDDEGCCAQGLVEAAVRACVRPSTDHVSFTRTEAGLTKFVASAWPDELGEDSVWVLEASVKGLDYQRLYAKYAVELTGALNAFDNGLLQDEDEVIAPLTDYTVVGYVGAQGKLVRRYEAVAAVRYDEPSLRLRPLP